MNSKQFQEINGIVESIQQLIQQALVQYTPLVDSIIRSQTKDSKHIEHTLDGILDFAYDEKMLLLFKKLCRYYLTIDPQATYDYINTYREMWDSDSFNDKEEMV